MAENITATLTDLISGILTEGFIIVALCFVIGQIIKTSKFKFLEKIDNNKIPIITAIVGMALSLSPEVFPNDTIVVALIKGAVSGWAATGAYETFRRCKKESSDCEEEIIDK